MQLGFIRKVNLLWHRDEPIGICVFTTPCVSLQPRNRYFGIGSRWTGLQLRALNAQLTTLSRVVLHPTYRGIGLAAPFVRRCCEMLPYPWIETLAEMGHFNPFFEKAGFQRVGVCRHAERSLDGHSALYTKKQTAHGRQNRLSNITHEKSRHAAPVYYLFDNRARQHAAHRQGEEGSILARGERIPLFETDERSTTVDTR